MKFTGYLFGLFLLMLFIGFASFPAQAATALYTGEVISGMNKICYYNHLGSTVAITIPATQLCPLSINL